MDEKNEDVMSRDLIIFIDKTMNKKNIKPIPTKKPLLSWSPSGKKIRYNFRTRAFLIRSVLFAAAILLLTIGAYRLFFSERWSQLNYEWGLQNLEEGRFDEAAANFERASSGENEVGAKYKLAVSKYNQKDFEGAAEAYEEVLRKDPRNADALNGLGNIYRDQRNFSKAQDSYRKASLSSNGYVAAYSNWAIMLMDEGKLGEAKEVIRNGLEKNPQNKELLNLKKILDESS